ncbi:hypothetical protein GYMLUDRAFT_33658 [Collybiopsis luxurians FD-317 M1]|nr:hypothetical protein GYMLUDRAFT_33658 [Collybiopsis luxurians FD-317 M1]
MEHSVFRVDMIVVYEKRCIVLIILCHKMGTLYHVHIQSCKACKFYEIVLRNFAAHAT